jgi:hypothetical protein
VSPWLKEPAPVEHECRMPMFWFKRAARRWQCPDCETIWYVAEDWSGGRQWVEREEFEKIYGPREPLRMPGEKVDAAEDIANLQDALSDPRPVTAQDWVPAPETDEQLMEFAKSYRGIRVPKQYHDELPALTRPEHFDGAMPEWTKSNEAFKEKLREIRDTPIKWRSVSEPTARAVMGDPAPDTVVEMTPGEPETHILTEPVGPVEAQFRISAIRTHAEILFGATHGGGEAVNSEAIGRANSVVAYVEMIRSQHS